MKNNYPRCFDRRTLAVAVLVLCAVVSGWPTAGQAGHKPKHGNNGNNESSDPVEVAQVPLFLTQSESPIAVIDLPKDHSLFKAAYNDYSDLNGDGELETTYEDSIDYYGYFDTGLCYRYADNVFEPAGAAGGANGHYCSGEWSGNFLNWVTMSRMDILRKILYGGTRSADTATSTVLERAYLPPDAHAWAKYYNGDDIDRLTPFSGLRTEPPTVQVRGQKGKFPAPADFGTGGYPQCGSGKRFVMHFTLDDPSAFSVGDQVRIAPADGSDDYLIGGVCRIAENGYVEFRIDPGSAFGPAGKTYTSWTFTNLSRTGISFCNVTPGSGLSQDVDAPPLMRVAKGNYALWSASEKWQCQWSEERNNLQGGFPGGFRSNGNRAALSGLLASAENPSQARHGLGNGSAPGEYVVRVAACVEGAVVNQTCKRYPDGNLKPVGLLQRYGDDGGIHFALFTGSYNNNYSGGVLRANAKSFASEVNEDSDGTFTDQAYIVDTIDKLRILGFSYKSANHYGDGDNCTYQLTNPRSNPGEGSCRSWGNPIAEIYLESLRYLAGASANGRFVPDNSVMGLRIAQWEDPLDEKNYCAPLNVLAFNTSVNTHDEDQMDNVGDLGATRSARQLTNLLGDYEGITGGSWFVGNTPSTSNDLCTAKGVSGLGAVIGICPEAPSLKGSYLMAGTAWYARTHRIRDDLPVPEDDEKSLKVNTFGVQLASNVPRITVDVGGNPVTILPAYRLTLPNGTHGTGALVNFKVVEQTETSGRFYINWEDSNQGGDYDQDVWGILKYTVDGNRITVTTDTVSASTSNPQGFGYTISGTDADGPHFHSGIIGFDYDDPTRVPGCTNCDLGDAATSVTYTVGNTTAGSLDDPLYYAAKWGGFDDANGNGRPDERAEWDADGDGRPDHYFYATNPLGLEAALDDALSSVKQTRSSAASVAANSTRLQSGTYVYQATFSSLDWHGDLLAYKLDEETGELVDAGEPVWSAAAQLPDDSGRNIVTWRDTDDGNAGSGADFVWDALTLYQQGALASPAPDYDEGEYDVLVQEGRDRLAYIRGDRSHEGDAGKYRTRNSATVLGDIINSNPIYVGAQNFGYASSDAPGAGGYRGYVENKDDHRTPVLYVAANDGMLHGFDADSGEELLAYVPYGAYPKLDALTSKAYNSQHQYLVDGSPAYVDAYIDGSWGTYVIGTLGAGGKGVFALDVTKPEDFRPNDVLWEFSTAKVSVPELDVYDATVHTPELNSQGYSEDDFADLGYSVPTPSAVLLHNDKWAAIVANGYGSESGTAALFVIDLETGELIRKLDTKATGNNGLSTPLPVDIDGDKVFDYVYAGDLRGNLWKFDLTSSRPKNWHVVRAAGSKNGALFVAKDTNGNRQPITAQPEVGAHPLGGLMVYFGTGSFFAIGDAATIQTQSFYGIRDRGVVAGNLDASGKSRSVDRDDLLLQKFTTRAEGIESAGIDENGDDAEGDGEIVRLATNNELNDHDGWVIDLPSPGERQVTAPVLSRGRIIFTTLIPNVAPCTAGGTGFLVALDAFDGSRLDYSPFDINHDGKFSKRDQTNDGKETKYSSAVKSNVGIVGSPTLIVMSPQEERIILSGSSGELRNLAINPGPGAGPQSWRQLR